ncbi:MAG: ornithine carbamoyltransferase [Gammaproteobacteria bacterium RBG_16_51_14]|nr:MAG: ornithine carbamoyltransferase [Gammaproteobacteria bacterium RBG_16_51_14]
MKTRHFLTLNDLSVEELQNIINNAIAGKLRLHAGQTVQTLKGRVLAMVFEKSSTRTRVSFETGMAQLGGHAIYLSPEGTQLGRGEPLEDTARVLSNMVDCIMIRTFAHEKVVRFAEFSRVPVINGLSDTYHPCQILADMQTYVEHRGSIKGKTVAWLGDGNNMCHSYINAAWMLDFKLNIACPEAYCPDQTILRTASNHAELFNEPCSAVKEADLVVTDVWASMGQEQEMAERQAVFAPYQVNRELMTHAKRDALFMHCLPAHRGQEVTADVIDGQQSVVWDEAGNRLHSQKALLEFLLL